MNEQTLCTCQIQTFSAHFSGDMGEAAVCCELMDAVTKAVTAARQKSPGQAQILVTCLPSNARNLEDFLRDIIMAIGLGPDGDLLMSCISVAECLDNPKSSLSKSLYRVVIEHA